MEKKIMNKLEIMVKPPAVQESWGCVAASIVGMEHVRSELPCQDASAVVCAPRAAAIVCDGAGSAVRSHDGAKAAVAAFKRGLGLFEPWFAQCLDESTMPTDVAGYYWHYICEWLVRAMEESKLELVREQDGMEKDYDYTVAFVVTGKAFCGFFQIGDGMIIAGTDNALQTVFAPEKGQFVNETRFLRVGMGCRRKFKAEIMPRGLVDRVAITSDGPTKLLFDMKSNEPSKLFCNFFKDVKEGALDRADLCKFLTCRKWSEIGAEDDKSLALLAVVDTRPEGKDRRTATIA